MWILYYDEDCGDCSRRTEIAVSSVKERLESRKEELINISKGYLKKCQEYNEAHIVNSNLYYARLKDYLLKNIDQLRNPEREDGVWIKEWTDYPAGWFFCSGASYINDRLGSPKHNKMEIGPLEKSSIIDSALNQLTKHYLRKAALKLLPELASNKLYLDIPNFVTPEKPKDYFSDFNSFYIEKVEEL
jgi:hypothetical protein